MKKLLFTLFVIASLISCSQEKKEAKQKNENATENKVVAVYETYEMEIDLSDIPAGVYFCVFKTSEGIQTKKMIKL